MTLEHDRQSGVTDIGLQHETTALCGVYAPGLGPYASHEGTKDQN